MRRLMRTALMPPSRAAYAQSVRQQQQRLLLMALKLASLEQSRLQMLKASSAACEQSTQRWLPVALQQASLVEWVLPVSWEQSVQAPPLRAAQKQAWLNGWTYSALLHRGLLIGR
jgi:hypothetical protein